MKKKRLHSNVGILAGTCILLLFLLWINGNTERLTAKEGILDLRGIVPEGIFVLDGWVEETGAEQTVYRMTLKKDAAFSACLYLSSSDSCSLWVNGTPVRTDKDRNYCIVYLEDAETIQIRLAAERQDSRIQPVQELCICPRDYANRIPMILMGQILFTIGICTSVLLFSVALYVKKKSERYLIWLALVAYITMGRALCTTFPALNENPLLRILLWGNIFKYLPVASFVQLNLNFWFRSLFHMICMFQFLKSFLDLKLGKRNLGAYLGLYAMLTLPLLFHARIGYFCVLVFDVVIAIGRMFMVIREQERSPFTAACLKISFCVTAALWLFNVASDLSLIRHGLICMAFRYRSILFTVQCVTLFIIACERFAKKFQETDALSAALLEMNAGLEERIDQKTRELQRSYEDLKELHETRSHLVSSMTHNLKTPLCSLGGYADMAEHYTDLDTSRAKYYLQLIRKNSRYMMRALDELFLFSRLEDDHVEFEYLPFSLRELLQSVFEDSCEKAKEKEIKISLEAEADPAEFTGDPLYLQQAIQNIADNGIEHGRPKGMLQIQLVDKEDAYWIRIRDDGEGIENSEQSRIFERYYSKHRGKRNSSGLGLTIAKSIVEKHGGGIWVESHPGEGSLFAIVLPKNTELRD